MSHPLAERILAGGVPLAARQAAARGALPIPREDLIELWVFLRSDEDPEVRMACKESLASVAEAEWLELLPSHPFRSEVLEFSLLVLGRNPKVLDAALRNRDAPTQIVEKVAGQASGAALDTILDNQTRLLQAPGILAAMLANPSITTAQVRRIYDIAEQFFRDDPDITTALATRFNLKIGSAGGAFKAQELEQVAPPPPQPIPTEAAEAQPFPEEVEGVVPEPLSEGEVIPQALVDGAVLTAQQTETLYQQILHMNIPKKVELALKGNKEARGVLIRDSNKTVQIAVVSSPKVTAEEAETIARMRHLPEEVFRKMALQKNLVKKYSVIKTLAFNPKVPYLLAVSYVKRLNDMDLKFIAKDKGVSEIVRREAKRLLEAKMKK